MASPELQVGRFGVVDVAEGGVSPVARTRQHGITSAYLLRHQHSVAVERQKRVLALEKFLEIKCVGNADGGSVVTVAPGDPVAVLDPGHTGVILIVRLDHVGVAGLELDRLVVDLPVHAVFAEPGEYVHLHALVVAAEHSGKSVAERHHGTVEHTVGGRYGITAYNRVAARTPHRIIASFRTLFPGNLSFGHINMYLSAVIKNY